MSTPKVYTSQQFSQSQSIPQCPRCHEEQEMYIELGCGHKFCIVCITFSYLKYKNILTHENKLKCLQCEKLSELDEELDDLIKEIINKQLGPIVKNDSDGGNTVENNQSRMSINQGFVNGNGAYKLLQDNTQGHSMQGRSYERSYARNTNKSANNNNNNIKGSSNNSNNNSKAMTPSNSHANNQAHLINNSHYHNNNHHNNNNNNNNNKNSHYLRQHKQHKHTFKSQQQSLIASHTPPKHPNRFYSKCETPQHSQSQQSSQSQQQQQQSPSSSSSINRTDNCPIHQHDQISYICVTCSFKPLCYKCIKSNKHYNHQVKIIKKAIEIITQKLSLLNLQTIQKIENLQLYQKRLYDRKLIYEERVQKSIKQIKQIFLSLEKKIVNKTNEIIKDYQELCLSKIEEIQNKAQQNSQMLQKIKHFQSQVHQFLTHSQNLPLTKTTKSLKNNLKPSMLIKQFQQIQSTKFTLFPQNQLQGHASSIFKVHQQIIDPTNNYHNSQLIKWVGKISQEIDCITIENFNHYNNNEQRRKFNETVPVASILKEDPFFIKNKTVALRQCSSRDKMHKHTENHYDENYIGGKRIKTNVPISLNTSRDKRDKKHNTKTQQDERRLKSKANYKTQANTMAKNSVNTITEKQSTKQIPSYITKCIQKHHTQNSRKVSPFNNHTTTAAYMVENSKNISKIVGKTTNILNNNYQQTNNRKKMKDTGSCEVIKEKKPMIKSAKHVQGVVKKKK